MIEPLLPIRWMMFVRNPALKLNVSIVKPVSITMSLSVTFFEPKIY